MQSKIIFPWKHYNCIVHKVKSGTKLPKALRQGWEWSLPLAEALAESWRERVQG